MKNPNTLIEAVHFFADPDRCHEYVKRIKWPDGEPQCPQCQGRSIGEIASRRLFKCRTCKKQFSLKVGTIFEDSPLPLYKWLVAIWCIINARNGISSCELARSIGVTQKTAWFMLHRIRLAMKTPGYHRIRGEVETDETFVGGRIRNMHKDRRHKVIAQFGPKGKNKTVVQGLLERGGELRAAVVRDTKATSIQPGIRANVKRGSILYCDIGSWYAGLSQDYMLQQVNHMIEYVRGRIHVNTLEGFWSQLKRTITGTYVAVAPKHLDRYLDEMTRRFNVRGL